MRPPRKRRPEKGEGMGKEWEGGVTGRQRTRTECVPPRWLIVAHFALSAPRSSADHPFEMRLYDRRAVARANAPAFAWMRTCFARRGSTAS
eukprot:scaffold15759_cov112-Isochrysis_galbana.AAC.1